MQNTIHSLGENPKCIANKCNLTYCPCYMFNIRSFWTARSRRSIRSVRECVHIHESLSSAVENRNNITTRTKISQRPNAPSTGQDGFGGSGFSKLRGIINRIADDDLNFFGNRFQGTDRAR